MEFDFEAGRRYRPSTNQGWRAIWRTARLLRRGFKYFKPTHPVGAAVTANFVEHARKRFKTGSPPRRTTPPSPPNTPTMSRIRSRSRGRSRTRRSPARRRSRSRSRSGSVLSRQHDQRTTYTSGRGSSRRRRSGSGYRIQNALCRMEPLQTWTAKSSVNGTSNANQNGIYAVGLFTTQMVDQPDLSSISTDAATSTDNTQRMWIKSACLDVEFKNTGSSEIIMDIYTLMLRQDTDATENMYSLWQDYFNMQTAITSKSAFDVANSVFQNPQFCKYFKVLSKREVMVLPGEISALQMRRGKDLYVPTDKITTNNTGIPYACKFYFFMWHGPPDPTAGGGDPVTPGVASTTITFSWQKSYTYALVPGTRTKLQIHNS